MERIVFLDRDIFSPTVRLRTPRVEHEWVDHPATRPDQVEARLSVATIAMTSKVRLPGGLLGRLPNLRMINVAGTGTDNVDLEWCDANGVVVSNSQGYATTAVPEHTFALIFALRRRLFALHDAVRQGRWGESEVFCLHAAAPLHDLRDARLGIVGRGSIGGAVGRIGEALGMDVVYAGRRGAGRVEPPYLPFREVLETSDVLTLHCPLRPETRGLIGREEFALMYRRPLLINTGRGGLVDEPALIGAMEQGLIAGAGFDVLSAEPPRAGNPLTPLMDRPDFILTPHVAWATQEAMETQAEQLVENIEAFCAGRPVRVVAGA